MRAADPAVDPEQLDAIGLAVEHAPSRLSRRELDRTGCTSDGGTGSPAAVSTSRTSPWPTPRARGRPTCRRETARPRAPARRRYACCVDCGLSASTCSSWRSVRERPSRARAALRGSARAPPRGTASPRSPTPPAAASARGSSGPHVVPDRCRVGEQRCRHRHPLRPERLELVGGQLTEAAEAGPARERADLDQLERLVRHARLAGRARARRAAATGRRGRARTRERRDARRAARRAAPRRAHGTPPRATSCEPHPATARNAARASRNAGREHERQRPFVQERPATAMRCRRARCARACATRCRRS